ncbi:M61 family metallopeptidase [Aquincola tertiaricarbonis]|uniref:M61 family metallopeptidase n=1 Tax=Aquincola tertiaricarbonis TaxID=391953 RepID=UPI000614FB0D|nr:PDZ domain-containing protein [Aquincola tertiaricarbonis]
MITYRIDVADVHAHLYRVTLTVPQPAPEQVLSLPVWIPGSYMVREFGRHLSEVQARQGRTPVPLQQRDKTSWIARPEGRGALTLSYLVYAFDTSVRTAFLNASRGFFNNTSLCLRVEGREAEPHRIELGTLPRGWEVATAMPTDGPRAFVAADYDELVDHPFELGSFWRGRFEVAGVPHEFVVAGAWPGFDGDRLLADTRRICEAQVAFWHGPQGQPPYERYVFMLNTVEEGYGGLEHRASTALIANRRDLPRPGVAAASDGYVTLLGLISHEFFHTWNVKRLKPAPFAQFDYTRENYTELLWFFEGFTSYYDDQFLLRAGLIDAPRYLKLIGKTVNGVLAGPGRKVQSVAQASFDAWVKYYRADENTPNATVSYYTKGSLVAMALDLTLRAEARGSLDDVMRALWAASDGGPVDEAAILAALQSVGRRSYADELAAWVHGTDDLPLQPLLERAGVAVKPEPAGWSAALGLRLSEGAVSGVQVRQVLRGSAAERAGVSAGDELLAVDGWRIRRLDDAQQWVGAGLPFELLLARDQRLHTVRVVPEATPAATLLLSPADKPAKSAAALRRAWLGC